MGKLSDTLPIIIESTALRRFFLDDLSCFKHYRSDKQLARYQGWEDSSLNQAENFISEMSMIRDFKIGGWVQLAISSPELDVLYGDIGIFLNNSATEAEIGITVAHKHQGYGHGLRALCAALNLIWQVPAIASVKAITDSRNSQAIKLLERAGFHKKAEYTAIFKGEQCVEYRYEKYRDS